MTKLMELAALGQSMWYDYIKRSLITSGEMKKLVELGIRGVTSNPSIFEKAIAGSQDYDVDFERLVDTGLSADEIYESLAFEDIAAAADVLRPLYDETEGRDGFVSIEVDPRLAHETKKTIDQAKRIFTAIERPNVMIKVPATEEGMPAVVELIGSGVNVNVTLIFGIDQYAAVAESYIKGLEILAERGPAVEGGLSADRIGSVASFFVSRVDTACDAMLQRAGNMELQGKIGIANCKVAYHRAKQIFSGPRWEALEKKGTRIQRLLWASTGVKDPRYPDTLYVDELIGPDTVNTAPPNTVDAFTDHGTAARTLDKDVETAEDQLIRLAESGIDLKSITDKLLDDGVGLFEKAFVSLMTSIEQKKNTFLGQKNRVHANLGAFEKAVRKTLERFRDEKIVSRIWDRDHTVWSENPKEIANRLGWLFSPEVMKDAVPEMRAFIDEVKAAGYSKALLLGMGGSSLAPEVFKETFGVRKGYLDLTVLDSTDPGAVLDTAEKHPPEKTLYIVSTKSGGTVETASFMKFFYNRAVEALGKDEAGRHFIAITDKGSSLEDWAGRLHFRKVFFNDPDIGGRYSALSYFGLVPAALLGADVELLLERGKAAASNAKIGGVEVLTENASALLGAAMGEAAKAGRDKLTFILSSPIAHFGAWVEQLIAESTGKEGVGILPVVGEALLAPEFYKDDRIFVHIRLDKDDENAAEVKALEDAGHPVLRIQVNDPYDIGGQFFLWETATAVAGMVLGINPFDQPNVESAKVLAKEMMAAYHKEGALPKLSPTIAEDGLTVYTPFKVAHVDDAIGALIETAEKEPSGGSYVAIQAYLKPDPKTDAALEELRTVVMKRSKAAVTVGYGPRFLHSTGQLHKGDAGRGLFIQFTAANIEDADIPDEPGKRGVIGEFRGAERRPGPGGPKGP